MPGMPAGSRLRHRPAAGMVVVAMLATLCAVLLLLVTGWHAAGAARAAAVAAQRQQQALAAARERLSDWYRSHLAELDAPGSLPPDPLPALAGLPAAAGLRVSLGELAFEGDVAGRVLRLQPAVTPPGEAIAEVVVDGRVIERAALAKARRQLQDLAARLEIWFRARVALDPLHRLDRNHYLPADPGCLALPDELPCLPDYAQLDGLAFLHRSLALDDASVRTPWGSCCPIEASNGTDASTTPPYSLALRIRTPWNAWLQVQAVQAGGA